jgi:cell division protein FtsL
VTPRTGAGRSGRLRAVPPPAEARTRRRRLNAIAAACGLAVAFTALSSQYGKTYTLARQEAQLEQRRRDLLADNARLQDEIQRLQTDDRYIEEIARRQLGMVRPGEIELLVVPIAGTVNPPGAAQRGGAPAPAADSGPSDAAPAPRPRRGPDGWAVGVRDAVLHLLSRFHR